MEHWCCVLYLSLYCPGTTLEPRIQSLARGEVIKCPPGKAFRRCTWGWYPRYVLINQWDWSVLMHQVGVCPVPDLHSTLLLRWTLDPSKCFLHQLHADYHANGDSVAYAYIAFFVIFMLLRQIVNRCQSTAPPVLFNTHGSYIRRQFRSKKPQTSKSSPPTSSPLWSPPTSSSSWSWSPPPP